jgi:hypothetical protein
MNWITPRRLFAIMCVGAITLAVLAGPAPSAPGNDDAEIDEYLNLRQNVLDVLHSSFANLHPYVGPARTAPDEMQFRWPIQSRNHLRHTLVQRQYDGQHIQKFLLTLPIDPDRIPRNDARTTSLTMESTAILNHYLSPLDKLGLECRDTPMAAIASAQYAAKTWIPTDRYEQEQVADSPIWVEGEVFYAPNEKTVIMRVTVGGRFTPKGR